jgi:hypothetical protein
MQYLKTLIKTILRNATQNPKTTATGIVILVAALSGAGASFSADSAGAQAQIAIVSTVLTGIAAAVLGANSKE